MYDKLLTMLSDIGIETAQATPDTTFSDLRMDSLSLTEIAVIASEETGAQIQAMSANTTLGDAAALLENAAALPR